MIFKVSRGGGIGDCLMTIPALRLFKKVRPDAQFHYYTSSTVAPLLKGCKYIDKIIIDDNTNESPISDMIYFQIPLDGRKQFLSPLPTDFHHTIHFANNLGLEGIDDMKSEIVLDKFKHSYSNFITIHPHAGWTANKRWQHWQKVVDWLNKKYTIVQIGGKDDPLLKGVQDARGGELKSAASLIHDAVLHIGEESWTNHACAALGKKGVIIFGSSSPYNVGYDGNINLSTREFCNPCWMEPGPLTGWKDDICDHHSCMRGITPSTVKYVIYETLNNPALEKPQALSLREKGIALRGLSDFKGAKEAFNALLSMDISQSERARAFINLGELSQPLQAIEYFKQRNALNPKSDMIASRIASISLSLNKIDDALHFFHEAISINKCNPFYYAAIGDILTNMGKSDEAKSYFSEAVRYKHPFSSRMVNKNSQYSFNARIG